MKGKSTEIVGERDIINECVPQITVRALEIVFPRTLYLTATFNDSHLSQQIILANCSAIIESISVCLSSIQRHGEYFPIILSNYECLIKVWMTLSSLNGSETEASQQIPADHKKLKRENSSVSSFWPSSSADEFFLCVVERIIRSSVKMALSQSDDVTLGQSFRILHH